MSWSVLIVNNEPMTRDLLRLMLRCVGFTVFEAEDGLDALDQVKRNRPDVMILDVVMPDAESFAYCETLCREEVTADLPMIVLSAKAHLNAVKEGLHANATRYLLKPVSRNDLIMNLREVLDGLPTPAMGLA